MSSADDFEDLLADCVARVEADGPQALEELCARHPASAARLRRSFARLRGIGFLGEDAAGALPERIGDFAVVARLGRGGMGVVYLARDARTNELVAVKMGPAPLEPGERSTVRFEREMRALTGLAHENLVRVRDVGSWEGRPYYTMDFVAGATLLEIQDAVRAAGRGFAGRNVQDARAIVRASAARFVPHLDTTTDTFGRTWTEFACRVVLDVARALGYLHAHGIVHRDVKPSNVLVGAAGRAFVFDLGLARGEDDPRLTRTGEFAGTPHYVAPEVARGSAKDATPRSDVFALGVTLHEVLTLRQPFDGPNAASVLAAIADQDPPPLRRVDPDLPRDLETIVATALEKDPAKRYDSMEAFAADLERFLSFKPVLARPIGGLERAWRFAKRRPALAAAIGLAATIAVGLPIGLWIANESIREQRDRAETAAKEAASQVDTSRRVSDFLVDLFRSSEQDSEMLSAAEMLERGSRAAEGDFGDQPLVRAALLEALGRVYSNFGDRQTAVALLDRSLAIRQRELGDAHVDTARVLHSIGALHLDLGEVDNARALFERSLAGLKAAPYAPASDEQHVRTSLGEALLRLGDDAGAEAELARALELLGGDGSAELSRRTHVRELLGRAQLGLRDLDHAAANLTLALEGTSKAYVPDLESRRRILLALAETRRAQHRDQEATSLENEAGSVLADVRSSPASRPARPWTRADSQTILEGALPAWASEYERSFQRAITALQANDLETAEKSFEACLFNRPRDAVCAYNMACVRALRDDLEGGLAWLARAAEFGGGRSHSLMAAVEHDPEIESLRADPRGAGILLRMHAAARDTFEPAPIDFPEAAAPVNGWPLIVFLRDEVPARAAPAAIDWATLAREHGCASIAPRARRLSGADVEARSVWVDSLEDFASRPWTYEEPILAEITRACEDPRVDRARVFLVSEGSGGWIAFDLATRVPGLVRGAWLVDGCMHPTLRREGARRAAATGSIVRMSFTTAAESANDRRTRFLDACRAYLEHCGFGAQAVSVGTESARGIESALREVLAAPPARR